MLPTANYMTLNFNKKLKTVKRHIGAIHGAEPQKMGVTGVLARMSSRYLQINSSKND